MLQACKCKNFITNTLFMYKKSSTASHNVNPILNRRCASLRSKKAQIRNLFIKSTIYIIILAYLNCYNIIISKKIYITIFDLTVYLIFISLLMTSNEHYTTSLLTTKDGQIPKTPTSSLTPMIICCNNWHY